MNSVSERTAVTVRVPGSTSNLGAGFDGLGLALSLYVELRVELTECGLEIEAKGREADQIDCGPDNLVYQRFLATFGSDPTMVIKAESIDSLLQNKHVVP
jgi:homoserine kinase